MRRRKVLRRRLRRTIRPDFRGYQLGEIKGNVWKIHVPRLNLIPLNSHLRRQWGRLLPPEVRK